MVERKPNIVMRGEVSETEVHALAGHIEGLFAQNNQLPTDHLEQELYVGNPNRQLKLTQFWNGNNATYMIYECLPSNFTPETHENLRLAFVFQGEDLHTTIALEYFNGEDRPITRSLYRHVCDALGVPYTQKPDIL